MQRKNRTYVTAAHSGDSKGNVVRRVNINRSRLMKRYCHLILAAAFGSAANQLVAATPVISSVSGQIQSGSTLTITGSNLTDENTSHFYSFSQPTSYGFEGTSPSSDGYAFSTGGSGSTAGYDTTIKLSGAKSAKFHAQGYYGPSGYPDQFKAAGNLYFNGTVTTEMWVRQYVRYSLNGGAWPGMGPKMTWYEGSGGTPYDLAPEPTGGPMPSRWRMWASATYNLANPAGQMENGRWYCIEEHIKGTSPRTLEIWVDGTRILNVDQGFGLNARWADFGMVNGWDTKTSAFNLDQWVDNLAVSKNQRVYCSSLVEISDSANYETATKRYQAPLYLSNGSIQIKVDLSSLGTGPYYLFVTNNRQERSQAYPLTAQAPVTLPSPQNLRAQ